jgi:signal peptidase II
MKNRSVWQLVSLSLFVVVLDQATKLLTKKYMLLGHSEKILGDFVRYTYIQNTGMAFGIHIGNRLVFTIFSLLASLVILGYLFKARGDRPMVRVSLALILGGAIGNLIDRIFSGAVVDFIDVGIGSLRWPVFNVADSAVSIGMILLISVILFTKENEHLSEKQRAESHIPVD